MKVFMPYLVWNTVFDNTRVTTELGRKPVPFSQYSFPLLKFSRETNFHLSLSGWPACQRRRIRRMMDFILEAWVSAIIESQSGVLDAGQRQALAARRKTQAPFAGYNGTRNTGSDVRVEEMLRQSATFSAPTMLTSA